MKLLAFLLVLLFATVVSLIWKPQLYLTIIGDGPTSKKIYLKYHNFCIEEFINNNLKKEHAFCTSDPIMHMWGHHGMSYHLWMDDKWYYKKGFLKWYRKNEMAGLGL